MHSARYAGPNASDSDRLEKLLSELGDVSKADRAARFVCAAAFADSAGNVIAETSGVCYGTIAEGPRGLSGFGYDPIFLLKGSDKTLAELDADTKNRISHRALAARALEEELRARH